MRDNQLDIPIRARPYSSNCLKWYNDQLILISAKVVRVIDLTIQTRLQRPNEIEAVSEDYGMVEHSCTEENLLSLAEMSDIRIVEAAQSPDGMSDCKMPFMAVLTADHRVAIYEPTSDPKRDPWKVRHALLSRALEKLGHSNGSSIHLSKDIKRLRTTALSWTSPYFDPSTRWGYSFLLTGNEAGELLVHRVDRNQVDDLYRIECSQDPIARIVSADWTSGGSLNVIVSDLKGRVFHLQCSTKIKENVMQFTEVSEIYLLFDEKFGICTNIGVSVAYDSMLYIAAAYSGQVQLATLNLRSGEIVRQSYDLSYFAATAGICWEVLDEANAMLFLLSAAGSHVILHCDYKLLHCDVDHAMMSAFSDQKQVKLNLVESVSETVPDVLQLRYYGASMSPASIYLAMSYTVEPVNKVQYKIAATSSSKISFIAISQNIRTSLLKLLSNFQQNPYRISCATVLNMFERAQVSLSTILDSHPTDISNMQSANPFIQHLFYDTALNKLRLILSCSDSNAEQKQSAQLQLQEHMISEILQYGITFDGSLGKRGLDMLLRIANYVTLYYRHDSHLVDCTLRFYRTLQRTHGDFTIEINLLSDTHMEESDLPDREFCPACQAAVHADNNILLARCTAGHSWTRCSITLELLSDLHSRTCLGCERHAVQNTEVFVSDETFYATVVDAFDMCFYCTGKWHVKI